MSNAVQKMIPTSVQLDNIELKRIQERTARLFSALEEAMESASPDSFDSFSPAIDICESTEIVSVYVELPGVPFEDINLFISAKEISIEGDKRHSMNTEKALSHYCCERSYGRFKRRIHLRWAVNISAASASLANGTLHIKLPKLEDRRGRPVRIPISVED